MAIDTTTSVDVQTLTPFKKFIMTIGVLPTSYIESMTYAELLMWFCDYLQNTVIPTVNNNAQILQDLINITPEFINQKLDEMAEDGTLENLLNNYANLTKSYNTYTEMINDSSTFTNGLRLKTLGYYSVNDGGGAEYYISNNVISTNYQIELQNNLYLNLIIKDSIKPEQIGAYGDEINDDSEKILDSFNIAINENVPLLLTKKYYINTSITLNGHSNSVTINQTSGHFKIDKSITIYDIINSKINLILNGGGSGSIENNSIIFEKNIETDFNLTANNVLQTAFCMNDYSGSLSRNTAIIKGNNNIRTLFHGSLVSGSFGAFFGTYLDIEDRYSVEPIHFENCADITILHIENYFEDTTYTKNSVEFYNVDSIHISVLALGGICKNLLYLNNSNVAISDVFVNNEDRTSNPSKVTGIFCKNDCEVKIFILRNIRCLYALDASEILYPRKLVINRVILKDDIPDTMQKGIYIPSFASNDNYLLSYNNINNIDSNFNITSDYGNVQNIRCYKKHNIMYINGYMTLNQNISANSIIFKINNTKANSLQRCDFIAYQSSNVRHLKISANTAEIKSDADILLNNGDILAFNFVYPTLHFDSY